MSRLSADEGVSTIELIVWTPLVVLVFGILPVQVGVWFHTQNLLTAAAHEAAATASLADQTPGQARAAGRAASAEFIGQSPLVTRAATDVVVGGGRVNVSVQAAGPAVLPGLQLNYRAQASAAVER